MTPRRSRGWWMLGAAVALAGCGSSPNSPDAATPDATADVAVASDLGPADASTADVTAPLDAPAVDAPPADLDVAILPDIPALPDVPVPGDVPADRGAVPAACADGAIVDLAPDGGVVRYLGTNAAAPRGPSLRATCVGADGTGEAVYQVVHRYVPRGTGRLRVSLDDAATAASFDTVLFVQSDCAPLPPGQQPLGCNDDVDVSVAMRPVSSALVTGRVLAGVPVFIVVAGLPRDDDDPLRPQGAYALTVTELPEVAPGAGCDPTGTANSCATASSCVDAGSGPRCLADGTTGARCRDGGGETECDAGLRCLGATCQTTLALGAVCGVGVTGVCPEESTCQWVDGANHCVATGARASDCRDDAPRCDTGLACVHTRFGDNCRSAVAAAASCDPWGFANACAGASACGFAALGVSGTCVAPGSVAGAACLPGATARCAAGLDCVGSPDNENEVCVRESTPGGRCDPLGATTVCTLDTNCVPTATLTDGVCAAAGTAAGAPCRAAAPQCDGALACSVTAGDGHCLRAVATGATCDLHYSSTLCTGGGCVADSATAATCHASVTETEPNDAPATAPLLAGASVVLSGALAATDPRDCVRVAVTAGSSLVAETFTGDDRVCDRAAGDPSLTVYGPGGGEVVSEDDSPRRGLCTTIAPWTHPQATGLAAGTYAVCVGHGADAVAHYRLTVSVYR